ncbi:transposase [Desulfosarcina ovata]|uniref:Transposase IS200-like domain-containing protein n=1 Tax=Desulfosarcina ovata subsp. ovata TaxID=2752305 RepID=A0A5K8AFH3_9BACT|nr:transposase [Desulfosarcina ovata]BBO91405.1 hypothetical protein DSCOOX_45850 [Desulfosarcina ovata subsp. ovata]
MQGRPFRTDWTNVAPLGQLGGQLGAVGDVSNYLINLICLSIFAMKGAMPRLARLDAPGILHHVIIRGIERKNIFRDTTDKQNLVDRLDQLVPQTQTRCYAWVLLSNHAHFLFRSGPDGLVSLMQRLLTGYAVSFNRRHKRHGQLFQNRYKSIICQEDAYLLELVRYIHLNPLRAGMVEDFRALTDYPFSGHRLLVGADDCSWQDGAYVLGCFGKKVAKARKAYLDYVQAGVAMGRRPELVGGGLVRSLCTNELCLSQTELARALDMTMSGIGYAARRGETIAACEGYVLIDSII